MTSDDGPVASAGQRPGDRHQDLRSAVVAELRRRIVSGELTPGEPLREDQVAEELGVSRNPVREGLLALAGEGLVEMTPRRSGRVVVLDDRKVRQIFEVRGALEGLAARLATENATPAGIERLRAVVDEGRVVVDKADSQTLAVLNSRFHEAIVDLAGNQYLARQLAGLDGLVQLVFSRSVPIRRHGSWAEHADLVDAIARRDATHAEWLATSHVMAAQATAEAILRGLEPVTAPAHGARARRGVGRGARRHEEAQ